MFANLSIKFDTIPTLFKMRSYFSLYWLYLTLASLIALMSAITSMMSMISNSIDMTSTMVLAFMYTSSQEIKLRCHKTFPISARLF